MSKFLGLVVFVVGIVIFICFFVIIRCVGLVGVDGWLVLGGVILGIGVVLFGGYIVFDFELFVKLNLLLCEGLEFGKL